MERFHLNTTDRITMIQENKDAYLKNKSPDCILYSQEGKQFKIHKEIFSQTDFLREILSSTKEHCCEVLEILCPCTKVELGHLVNFLYNGEVQCENESELINTQLNLRKIFGFPYDLNLQNPDQVLSDTQNDFLGTRGKYIYTMRGQMPGKSLTKSEILGKDSNF